MVARTRESLPPNYQVVLDVIEAAGPGAHLTASAVWERARTIQPRIGFATVHRGLARLHESHRILKIQLPGEASTVYEPASEKHAHFVCSACGTIVDLEYRVPPAVIGELASRYGYTIDAADVHFTGRCSACT